MDCADRDRIDEAKQELHRIVNDREMKDAIVLIFANKQDLPDGTLCMYMLASISFVHVCVFSLYIIFVFVYCECNISSSNCNV